MCNTQIRQSTRPTSFSRSLLRTAAVRILIFAAAGATVIGATWLSPQSLEAQSRGARAMPKKAELTLDDKKILISYDALPATDELVHSISTLDAGGVLAWPHGRAIKITNEVGLEFANGTLKAGNASPDYPGVYSIWPKRTGDGWGLVFNQYADVWGTMHDPSGDALTVAAEHSISSDQTAALEVELVPNEAATGAALVVKWGEHLWRAQFSASP
jgi:hypothetical protein